MTTFDRLQKILVERFVIKLADIQPDADLQEDLKLDSMDAIDLLLAVNETFSIRIPEKTLEQIHTVADLVEAVKKYQQKARP